MQQPEPLLVRFRANVGRRVAYFIYVSSSKVKGVCKGNREVANRLEFIQEGSLLRCVLFQVESFGFTSPPKDSPCGRVSLPLLDEIFYCSRKGVHTPLQMHIMEPEKGLNANCFSFVGLEGNP